MKNYVVLQRTISAAPTPKETILAALLALFAGCSSNTVDAPEFDGVSLETYARGYCDKLCAKYDECGPLSEDFGGCNVQECMEAIMNDFSLPCFTEEDEFGRCLIERESCEEYFDINIDTSMDSACYPLLQIALECIERER